MILLISILIQNLTSFFVSSFMANKSFFLTLTYNVHVPCSSPLAMLKFFKYQGLGNDFIIFDNRNLRFPSLTPKQSSSLCNRHFNIGADGVIFALAPPLGQENVYDYSMRIFNSDGSEPEMCGNGIRCLSAFIRDTERKSKSDKYEEKNHTYSIHTMAGKITPTVNADGTITVDMGKPVFEANKIPMIMKSDLHNTHVIERTVTNYGKLWTLSAVNMGNPHAVIFVHNLQELDLQTDGPLLECHPSFPEKTNVEFVQVLNNNHLKMKVWERGCGETLACGTGACAVVVAALKANKILPSERFHGVKVSLPGGDLMIHWTGDDTNVLMTGPATFCFRGELAT